MTCADEWKRIRDQVADEVSAQINLEEDPILNEIRTAETKEEAVGRIESIIIDAEVALDVILTFKPKKGPKDWTPVKRARG